MRFSKDSKPRYNKKPQAPSLTFRTFCQIMIDKGFVRTRTRDDRFSFRHEASGIEVFVPLLDEDEGVDQRYRDEAKQAIASATSFK